MWFLSGFVSGVGLLVVLSGGLEWFGMVCSVFLWHGLSLQGPSRNVEEATLGLAIEVVS